MTTDQNYQQIYRVGGMLDAGFVGQITYTISLDQVYDELDIHFSFDKRLYSESDVTPELIDRLQPLCKIQRPDLSRRGVQADHSARNENRNSHNGGIKRRFHRLHPPPADGPPHVIHKRIHKRRLSGTGHLFRRFKSDRPCFQRAAGQHAVHADRFRTSGRTWCNRTEL